MTEAPTPRRRRVVVAATAVLTAVATVAGMGALMAVTSSPSQASPTAAAQAGAAAKGVGAAQIAALPQASTQPTPTPEPSVTTDPPTVAPATGSAADIKNVVLLLADDLDWALFDQIPRLAALRDKGTTFTNFTVTDSLCCPSRTSILRGQYIHNHGVVSNMSATGGGWPTFRNRGEQNDCLPVWLQSAGVTTGLFGKFLNDYPQVQTRTQSKQVPPGWDAWSVPVSRGDSYTGYDYVLNTNGQLTRYGSKPTDFLNDVITQQAVDFIGTAPDHFFLELATYNPHKPAPVALRNKATHLDTVAPRTPNYNAVGTNEPTWLQEVEPLGFWKQENLDKLWRQRAQSAESVADSYDAVLAQLQATGHVDDTLVVITSDNGYHAGSHRLSKGKRTAFREDTVVPMIAIGPGVAAGATVDAMTTTIDLAPTITQVLGATAPAWVDGRSLAGIIGSGGTVPDEWRTATLQESMGISRPGDPDYQIEAPPQFTALRSQDWLFVVYKGGERELYDLRNDPYELNNIASTADPGLVASLYSQMQLMRACTGDSCRTADAMPQPGA